MVECREGGVLVGVGVDQLPAQPNESVEEDVVYDPSHPMAWMDHKLLCAQAQNRGYFEEGGSVRCAKEVCVGCGAVAACLEYAMDFEEPYGVWGSLSKPERGKLKWKRRGLRRSQ